LNQTTRNNPERAERRPDRGRVLLFWFLAGLTMLLVSVAGPCDAAAAVQPHGPASAQVSHAGSGHGPEHGHGEEHHGSGLMHGSPWLYVGMSSLAMAFLIILGALGTRNLQKVPGRLQNFLELLVGGLESFYSGILGPGGERHVPFLVTTFLFILTMNLMGLIPGFKPATATLNMTIALALVAITYVQIQGIRQHGLWGYIRHYMGEPLWLAPLMLPLHIIGELAKPLSLSLRLFGNIFGEETVILQLALLGPLVLFGSKVLPLQFPIVVFGVFTSVVQALVFTVLTSAYILMITSGHEEHEEHHAERHSSGRAEEAASAA
jgi:F-type H+-transporting ATPase subunit a